MTQTPTPTASGSSEVGVKPGRDIAAASATRPITTKTRIPAQRRRAESTPASAPSSRIATVMVPIRIGLSLRPTSEMNPSATGPGVDTTTTSATDCTGVARAWTRLVSAWLTVIPASAATAPARAR